MKKEFINILKSCNSIVKDSRNGLITVEYWDNIPDDIISQEEFNEALDNGIINNGVNYIGTDVDYYFITEKGRKEYYKINHHERELYYK